MLSCLTDNPIALAGINSLARGQLGANIETLKVSHHRELHDVSPLLRCDRLRVLVGIECPHWRSIPQLLAKGVRVEDYLEYLFPLVGPLVCFLDEAEV